MHRDQKIGLALGVLLIGAVAAFFFRNERSSVDGVPAISNVVELDAVIAEKSFRPYLGDSSHSPDRIVTRPVNDTLIIPPSNDPWEGGGRGKIEPSESSLPNPENTKNRSNDESAQDLPAIPWPDDVLDMETSRPKSGGPFPEHARTGDLRGDENNRRVMTDGTYSLSPSDGSGMERFERSGSSRSGELSNENSEAVTVVSHVVKKGETLSSLAQKYLGRESRYLEIFDANRDQLRDANGVRVGMVLKVPVSQTSRNIAGATKPSKNNSTTPSPSSGEKRMFVPFRPRPADAATLGPSTELPESAPRRLSQQPPGATILR